MRREPTTGGQEREPHDAAPARQPITERAERPPRPVAVARLRGSAGNRQER